MIPTFANWSQQEIEDFFDDPVAYFIQVARKFGVLLLVAGFLLGVLGYYLKAAATTALNTEQQILGNIGNIFSNIKAPSFQPAATGTAPLSWSLQGINNFAQDAANDVTAFGADVSQIGGIIGTLGEDVALGLTDIGKAILAFVMHTPDLLWNGMVWTVGGGLADIINFAFPYLIIVGGLLVIASLVAQGSRWVYRTYVQAGFRAASAKFAARAIARSERAWDWAFGNFRHPVAETVAPVPIQPVAPIVRQQSDAEKTPPAHPEGPGRIPTPPESPVRLEVREGPVQAEPASTPAEAAPLAPVIAEPNVVGATPTTETEAILGGEKDVREPTAEELRREEEARKETLPEEEESEESDLDRQRAILMAPLEA